jgi:hypothetical protein
MKILMITRCHDQYAKGSPITIQTFYRLSRRVRYRFICYVAGLDVNH